MVNQRRNHGEEQSMAPKVVVIGTGPGGYVAAIRAARLGACASDLIAEGALAVKTGRTIQELADTIHGHPTLAEIMSEVSMKALGKPIHG